MYIWKTNLLARDIKNDDVGAREWKKYYLAGLIFTTLSMYIIALSPKENVLAILIEAVASVVILIVGVNVTYNTNSGDRGVSYISRMVALSFPILIKLSVLSFLFGIIVAILGEAALISDSTVEWLMTVFSLVIQVIFFWRINTHLKYINT